MTTNLPRLDPSSAPGALLVEHSDVPLGMTLGEWRRHCAQERRVVAGTAAGNPLRRGLRRLFGA